jgi:hypothetical protein
METTQTTSRNMRTPVQVSRLLLCRKIQMMWYDLLYRAWADRGLVILHMHKTCLPFSKNVDYGIVQECTLLRI